MQCTILLAAVSCGRTGTAGGPDKSTIYIRVAAKACMALEVRRRRQPAGGQRMQSALSSVLLHVRRTCAFNLSGDWRGWEAPPPDAYLYGRPGRVGGWVVCLAPLPGCGPLGRMHMHQRQSAGRDREPPPAACHVMDRETCTGGIQTSFLSL